MPVQRELIQFGMPAAEDEGKALEHYFLESASFTRLRDGNKRILLGNRGSGKSALFRMLAAQDVIANNLTIELQPRDYSYQMLAEIQAARVNGNWGKSAMFAAAWKYLILTLALRKIAKIPSAKQRMGRDEKALQRFARESRVAGDQPIDLLVSYLQKFDDAKTSSHSGSQRTADFTRLYDLEELDRFVPLFDSIPGGRKIHVYVDELDQGWDGSEEAQAFVIGLFQACLSLNRTFPSLRVYIAIRQELFAAIPALHTDAQKYRDLYESLVWDRDSLFNLIIRRIRHYFPGVTARETSEDSWRRAFAERSSFRYMLDRSLYRPRELIVYCTEALEFARQHRRSIPMTQDTVELVESRVSRDRLDDILSEYQYQYPGLSVILKSFAQGPSKYSREKLEDRLLRLSIGETVLSSRLPSWANEAEPYDLMEVLWRIGFILVDVDRERGLEPWRPGSPDDPGVDLAIAAKFRISPMFAKSLRLSE